MRFVALWLFAGYRILLVALVSLIAMFRPKKSIMTYLLPKSIEKPSKIF